MAVKMLKTLLTVTWVGDCQMAMLTITKDCLNSRNYFSFWQGGWCHLMALTVD